MRRCLTFFLAVFPCLIIPGGWTQTAPLSPPQFPCSTKADAQALAQIPELWQEGYNSGRAEKVAALYAKEAYYLTQHFVTGIVHGRDAIQAYVQNGVDAKYRVDAIEVIHAACRGDLAYVITRYKSTNGKQKAVGVNLVVLQKRKGQWLIVAHEAAVPDPATAMQNSGAQTER
jgi:uncharacterized protein (TIGR02246 family)